MKATEGALIPIILIIPGCLIVEDNYIKKKFMKNKKIKNEQLNKN